MNGQSPDSSRQVFLQSALAKRDSITQGLAKGDPNVGAELQNLFQSTLETTQAVPK
jgi:hypothetical protein